MWSFFLLTLFPESDQSIGRLALTHMENPAALEVNDNGLQIQIYNLFSVFLLFRAASLQMSDAPPFFTLPFPLSRTRACQEVFVFILHLFTGMPQMVVAQRVRCEDFSFFRFTAAIDGVHGR